MQDAEQNQRASTSKARESSITNRSRGRPSKKLYGKNKYVWETKFPKRRSGRTGDTRVEYGASLIGVAENVTAVEQFWELLINKQIIDKIVECTNKKIQEETIFLVSENRAESYHHHTDAEEIRAYIGVLYYSGLWKANKVDNNELWDKNNGLTFYRCVFPRMRFEFLQSCIRFDKGSERNADDRFSPIRNVWTIFIENCSKFYKPSSRCTVDEQLLSFRGRCIFRMYMKSKPDKYGLKMVTLNDAENAYLIFAIPYLGKSATIENPRKLPSSEFFFEEITKPIHGTGRSVTCDNWFTTVPLMERMLQEPFNLRMTGTIRKNKREIPLDFKIASKQPPETKFCHSKDVTLLSYTPKKNKIVLVASTYMHTKEITNGKPDIILHYNNTKGGTDTFDQLCHAYTVTRRNNKWPMRVFFGMLDQAAVNSRIMFKLQTNSDNQSTSAIKVLKSQVTHLTTPFIRRRLETQTLRKDLKIMISSLLGPNNESDDQLQRVVFDGKRRCSLCNWKKDRKTKFGCSSCKRPVCEEHRLPICTECCGNY